MARRTATKAAPVEEPEEIEEELEVEDELDAEELADDDEEVESDRPKAKSKKAGKAKTPEITFGAADLANHLTEITGKTVTPRDLRVLLRKMARSGKLNREIVAGNRARYDWPEGLEHPEVKAVIKAVKSGEIEAGKKEALDALKAKKAAEGGKKAKATKAAPAPVEDDDEEFDDLEDE